MTAIPDNANLANEDDDDDSAWEASLHTKKFAEAYNEDGTIDYEKLRARTKRVSLDDLSEEMDDSAWEASLEDEEFAKAFSEDGTVDFDKLRAMGQVMSLDDFNTD